MSRNKWKSSSDVAGTTVVFKVLYCKTKNVFYFCVFFKCTICVKRMWPLKNINNLKVERYVLCGGYF